MHEAALFTARSNFTHLVACYKDPSHRLVKHGAPSSAKSWVAIKELSLSYYIGEPLLITIYTP